MVVELGDDAILLGGYRAEHDISLSSGNSILPSFQLSCAKHAGHNFDPLVLEILQQTI
jgi:D-alanine-D-alanine ligase-like ATP-grasp enzyme